MKLHPSYFSIIPLALSAFCMGVAELSMAGILNNLAQSLQISLTEAGYLTTLYAIGVIVGAPLLSVPLSSLHRKAQLSINLGIFALGNLVVFLSSSFYLTAVARFVCGCMHGVFFVIATLTCTQVAQKGKESQALALMVSGLTISMVSGVPLGAMIGNTYGYQFLFLCITVLTLCVLLSVICVMPANIQGQRTNLKGLIDGLKSLQMWRSFLITAGFCGSLFTFYTYVEPFFVDLGGFSHQELSLVLLIYGAFGILGNLIGGKLADKMGAISCLRLTLSLLGLSLFGLFFSIQYPLVAVANFCMVSFWGFACVSSIKMFSLYSAKRYTPKNIESSISLNEASFNLGIAIATLLGGVALAVWGVEYNPLIATLIALIALVLLPRKAQLNND